MAIALAAPAPTFKFFRIPFYKPAPAHIPAPAHHAPAQGLSVNTRPGSELTTPQKLTNAAKLTLLIKYCYEVPLEEIPERHKINCAKLNTKLFRHLGPARTIALIYGARGIGK